MQVIVESLVVSYLETGHGKQVIVFLHGWADSGKTFDALLSRLADAYTCIVLDLPGFGGSQQPEIAWGLQEYAQFVQKFLLKIGRAHPYAIVGHSNGGAIGIVGLARHILQADKLVLISSAGVRMTTEQATHRRLWHMVAKLGKAGSIVLPQSSRRKLRAKLYAAAGSDLLVAPHMQETFKKVVGQDVRSEAQQLSTPTLLIYGETDTATPLVQAQLLLSSVPSARLVVLPAGGHFVHQEQSERVAKEIKEFLS